MTLLLFLLFTDYTMSTHLTGTPSQNFQTLKNLVETQMNTGDRIIVDGTFEIFADSTINGANKKIDLVGNYEQIGTFLIGVSTSMSSRNRSAIDTIFTFNNINYNMSIEGVSFINTTTLPPNYDLACFRFYGGQGIVELSQFQIRGFNKGLYFDYTYSTTTNVKNFKMENEINIEFHNNRGPLTIKNGILDQNTNNSAIQYNVFSETRTHVINNEFKISGTNAKYALGLFSSVSSSFDYAGKNLVQNNNFEKSSLFGILCLSDTDILDNSFGNGLFSIKYGAYQINIERNYFKEALSPINPDVSINHSKFSIKIKDNKFYDNRSFGVLTYGTFDVSNNNVLDDTTDVMFANIRVSNGANVDMYENIFTDEVTSTFLISDSGSINFHDNNVDVWADAILFKGNATVSDNTIVDYGYTLYGLGVTHFNNTHLIP